MRLPHRLHPGDANVFRFSHDGDVTVKGLARFTRSIGDAHLKDGQVASWFNSMAEEINVDATIDPRKSRISYSFRNFV